MFKKILVLLGLVAIAVGAGVYYLRIQKIDQTSIYELVRNGSPWEIRHKISSGIDINSVNERGASLLEIALSKPDNTENILELIDMGAVVNRENQPLGALAIASVLQQDIRVFEALFAHGADVNQLLPDETTPIAVAAGKQKNPKVIQLFIDQGADVNRANKNGLNPLLFAIEMKSDPEIIALLAKAGADINYMPQQGTNLLFWAAGNDNIPALRKLVELGAKVDTYTFMSLLYHFPKPEVAEILAPKFDDLNFLDEQGNAPLSVAVAAPEADPETIKILLDHGADINFKDKKGMTALIHAAGRMSAPYTVQILKMSGYEFDLNGLGDEQSRQIQTEIERMQEQNLKLLKVLLAAKPDLNLQDKEGMTAYMTAVQMAQSPEFMATLLKAGARKDLKNFAGKSAEDFLPRRPNNTEEMKASK